MGRRILAVILLLLAVSTVIATFVLAFTPGGNAFLEGLTQSPDPLTPTPTYKPFTPTPFPTPMPILTAQGTPPTISATSDILLDTDTGHILSENNSVQPLPMASTTKIMTALIAIQTGNLDQEVTIHQDAYDEWFKKGGSSAFLKVNDQITLNDLLYALMLPSGDDAAIAIADALSGNSDNFVVTMNLFALRLHLYQTHYANPDGLQAPNHYTTAYDLARLARYAMNIPLFAKIVQAQQYTLSATAKHASYSWTNTNTLLGTYQGMTGIKTGYTGDAGYCLVFSATRAGHHLLGVVLNSSTIDKRFNDAKALLDWGFALPVLPPV